MVDLVAVGAEVADEVGEQPVGLVERLEVGDLAADMHVDAGEAHAWKPRAVGVDLAGPQPGNAELVLGLAGGDLVVGPGVDIRIDADGDVDGPSLGGGNFGDAFDLGFGFGVEAVDAGIDREGDLAGRLADPGKDDPLRRAAGGESAAKLAFGNHVATRSLGDQSADHRLVGVRLHGVADHRVEAGEGVAEDPVVSDQRRGRVAVERRADVGGDGRQGDVLGMEGIVAVVEVVHSWPISGCRRQAGGDTQLISGGGMAGSAALH